MNRTRFGQFCLDIDEKVDDFIWDYGGCIYSFIVMVVFAMVLSVFLIIFFFPHPGK